MDLVELKKQIVTKSVNNYFVFTGTEIGIMRLYIDQISKVTNKPIEYMNTVESAYERFNKSGLVPMSKVIVVSDDKSYLKAEKLWNAVPKRLKSNILILIYHKPDKRSKFFKSTNSVVSFNALPSNILAQYIMKKVSMSETNANQLAEVCECSYDRCMQECDKINTYIDYRKSIKDEVSCDMAFRLLLNEGIIYRPIGDITFSVVDAIMNRIDVYKIESMMKKVRQINEPKLLLFSLLYNNFRALLLYQTCPDKSKVTEVSGITAYEAKIAANRANRYSPQESLRALKLIQEIEFGVKTGKIAEDISLDYFIAMVI